jgi:hypothetical protein
MHFLARFDIQAFQAGQQSLRFGHLVGADQIEAQFAMFARAGLRRKRRGAATRMPVAHFARLFNIHFAGMRVMCLGERMIPD